MFCIRNISTYGNLNYLPNLLTENSKNTVKYRLLGQDEHQSSPLWKTNIRISVPESTSESLSSTPGRTSSAQWYVLLEVEAMIKNKKRCR